MSGFLHSRGLLPLIPPTPFSHTGRRGILGVLMPERGDGAQGLPKKSTPVKSGQRRRVLSGGIICRLRAGETPALPGGVACGRDARAPREKTRARRPHSQGARGSRFLVLGSRFGTPALPGRDARTPRPSVSLRLPDSGARFRRELLRRSAARAHRCRRSACDARDSRHRQSQRRA